MAALYGPLHGGANEAVLKMLDRIGTIDNIPDFLEGVKNREEQLMGFGHRVYKNFDPRAQIIKKHVDEVFEVTGMNPKLDIAVELEKRALDDDYFIERKLYPNVDFYSGLIYEALDLPHGHVHGDVRHPAHVRLGRAVARDGAGPGDEDRPPAADLHRRGGSATTCRSIAREVEQQRGETNLSAARPRPQSARVVVEAATRLAAQQTGLDLRVQHGRRRAAWIARTRRRETRRRPGACRARSGPRAASGPIGCAQPSTMPRSMSSLEAKPDSNMRIADSR